MVTLFGIRHCDTIRKARAWLDARGTPYAFHDYQQAGIEEAALRRWTGALGWETVLNRAGTTFRKLPDADRAELGADQAVALMLAQPSLIKRPIVEGDGILLAGFRPDVWAAAIG